MLDFLYYKRYYSDNRIQFIKSSINSITVIILMVLFFSSCNKNGINSKGNSNQLVVENFGSISKTEFRSNNEIRTKGFYKNDDGGGAIYILKRDGIVDGMTVAKTKNGYYAHLKLNESGYINVKQVGAYGDGIHLDQKCFSKAFLYSKRVIIPKGEYLIKTGVKLQSNTIVNGNEGTLIKGMFVLDNVENVTIENIIFESWNENKNYGIRISKNSCNNLKIKGCSFLNKCFVYQDKPLSYCSKEVSITDCKFEFLSDKKLPGITAIQLHTDKLTIKNCNFKISGIDGCIKNSSGTGIISVQECYFEGRMEEEVFDFYTYKGEVYFENNLIEISNGGVIRTKPGGIKGLITYPYSCFIRNNTIKHSGTTQNQIYLAGSYNLINNRRVGHIVEFSNNIIKNKFVTTPLNFRGIDSLIISDNTISGTLNPSSAYSIYLTSIKNVLIQNNSIKNGGIIGYKGGTPAGDLYLSSLYDSNWKIINNIFSNEKGSKNVVYINKLNEINLNISMNSIYLKDNIDQIFTFSNTNFKGVKVFRNTIYSNLKIQNNKIINWKAKKNHLINLYDNKVLKQ